MVIVLAMTIKNNMQNRLTRAPSSIACSVYGSSKKKMEEVWFIFSITLERGR